MGMGENGETGRWEWVKMVRLSGLYKYQYEKKMHRARCSISIQEILVQLWQDFHLSKNL